jgi:hypothetical protein
VSDIHFTNVKRNTTLDTITRPQRELKGSPTILLSQYRSNTSYHHLTAITCNTTIPTQHAGESNHHTHHQAFEANEANMRRRRKDRAIHRAYSITTPPPVHMHSVAPNRLQDALCNLWRLHISHCQHTKTH